MPERLSCASSSLKPSGSIRCNCVCVAAQRRAMFPVFGGISGSTSTMCMRFFSVVKYFPEHQAMGGRGHSGGAAISGMEHRFKIGHGELRETNLHQRAHNSPAHFIEEAIAFDDEREQRTFAHHIAAH